MARRRGRNPPASPPSDRPLKNKSGKVNMSKCSTSFSIATIIYHLAKKRRGLFSLKLPLFCTSVLQYWRRIKEMTDISRESCRMFRMSTPRILPSTLPPKMELEVRVWVCELNSRDDSIKCLHHLCIKYLSTLFVGAVIEFSSVLSLIFFGRRRFKKHSENTVDF